MMIKQPPCSRPPSPGLRALAVGGLFGALAASSCCILPVVLFSLGISGAWIANFTRLAPYQPIFIAAAIVFVGGGYWLVYRSSRQACSGDQACARPLSSRFVMITLAIATIIVIAAFGFDILAPYILS